MSFEFSTSFRFYLFCLPLIMAFPATANAAKQKSTTVNAKSFYDFAANPTASSFLTEKSISDEEEKNFYIPMEEAAEQLDRDKKLVLVDIRDSGEFKKFHINNSINIPLYAVASKSFLQNKSVVLVDEGYNPRLLEQEILKLRNAGFSSVQILRGGLNYWRRQKAPLIGDKFSQHELQFIPPKYCFLERDSNQWFIVGIDPADSGAERKNNSSIPFAANLPLDGNFVKSLYNQLSEKLKDKPFINLVLSTQNGGDYAKAELRANEISSRLPGKINVFFLKEGENGYQKFLADKALMRDKSQTKSVNACTAGCP